MNGACSIHCLAQLKQHGSSHKINNFPVPGFVGFGPAVTRGVFPDGN
jgi:hypothetical protein